MTARSKPSRLESEIEKCRVDGQWAKALELVKQLSSKSSSLDYYTHFILGEGALESYVKNNPATEQTSASAKHNLLESARHLNIVLRENGKMHLEASLLLAKVHYYQGNYQSALTLFDNANLENVSVTTASVRRLHIVAEANAIKGLCIEKSSPSTTSKYKAAEKEERILTCFELAGDLALLYLQEKEKIVQSWGTSGASTTLTGSVVEACNGCVGEILEMAIQQSPIYYIKHGELDKGVRRFRELLRAVESRFTQGLRLILARQLAEVLLRAVCASTYRQPDLSTMRRSSGQSLNPRKYSGDKSFIPHNESEEALLLLLIAEAVATREAVLNRSVEHHEARLHTVNNTTAVYDLLAIALARQAQFQRLADSFERAMKFSFEEFHIWHQFANSLICAQQFERAVRVLTECHRLRPKNVIILLQTAKVCYENLRQPDEGLKFSRLALEAGGEEHPMASRVLVALGVGYSLTAQEMKLKSDRQQLHLKALQSFKKAHVLDPSDYLSLFHLALQLAILRQIDDAVKYTRLALKSYSDHVHSLHLLVLLLTAQKQYQEAADLVNATLQEYPDNVSLLLTKSKIEEVVYGAETALNTCKVMMRLCKDLQDIDTDEKAPAMTMPRASDRTQWDRRSQAHLQLSEFTDRDSGSVRADSIAVSRIEKTLSDLASTNNSDYQQTSAGPKQTLRLQCQIWMTLSEVYLALNRVAEAESCVTEMSTMFPLSHQISYMRGRIQEHQQKFHEAKVCYENAISMNPFHTKSLQHLGMVLHHLDNNKLAEKVLRDSVNADPTSNQSWYCLGVVLEALGQSEAAVDCQMTALDLESTSPIVPFTVIPRLLQ